MQYFHTRTPSLSGYYLGVCIFLLNGDLDIFWLTTLVTCSVKTHAHYLDPRPTRARWDRRRHTNTRKSETRSSGTERPSEIMAERSRLFRARTWRPGAQGTLRRRDTVRLQALMDGIAKPSVGLSLSGGGLRSAMFCSGVLRHLLAKNVRLDFLSSVSGGGYVAGSYMEWKYREGGLDHPEWHNRFFEQMIANVPNMYMRFERAGFGVGFLDLIWVCGTLFFCSVIVTLLQVLGFLLPVVHTVAFIHGDYLRTLRSETTSVARSITAMCAPMVFSIASYALSTAVPRALADSLAGHLCQTVLIVTCAFSTIAANFLIVENITSVSAQEPWSKELLLQLILAAIAWLVWFSFPGSPMRRRVALIPMAYLLAYLTHKRLFVYYEDDSVRKVIDKATVIGFLLMLLSPLIEPLRQTIYFHLYRQLLVNTFFHSPNPGQKVHFFLPDMVHHYLDFSAKEPLGGDELTLSEINQQVPSPRWICQMVINNWRYDEDDPTEDDCKILNVSTKTADLLDHTEEDEGKYLDIMPHHVTVSTAIATSGAAVSIAMGNFQDSIKWVRELFIFFFRIGVNLPTWIQHGNESRGREVLKVMLINFILNIPIAISLTYPDLFPRLDSLIHVFLFLRIALATFPTGYDVRKCSLLHQWFYHWARLLVLHHPESSLMREIADVKNVGKWPGFMLHISDGGHIENLGVLALFKRRVNRIIIADGGLHEGITNTCDLITSMKLAREWLGCAFMAMDGGDVELDMMEKFCRTTDGRQPHCYEFKVIYNERDPDTDELVPVDEGHVLVVQPRHPDELLPGRNSGSLDDAWSGADADKLTGLLASSTHGFFPALSYCLAGRFPHFATQFLPTPQMTAALHREGQRTMESEAAVDFVEMLPQRREANMSQRRTSRTRARLGSDRMAKFRSEEKIPSLAENGEQ